MSGIGPELPPHLLAKRKRQREEDTKNDNATASGAKRSASPIESGKRRKIIGPAMPPAPLDQMPREPAESTQSKEMEESDDEDDFGPALPTALDEQKRSNQDHGHTTVSSERKEPGQGKLQRDEWMMMAPKQDDLAARMDPLKQRPKGFNTGKGARGPNPAGNDNSIWHETAEQKQKRLADEMMGVGKPSVPGKASKAPAAEKEAAKREVQATSEKARGPSLLETHKKTVGAEAEDDPSKRAFDREKDMGSGGRISSSQRREMLNQAANFSSKFSGGGLL